MQQVRFVNSGTEANMMALATAVAYTGKAKILVFTKGYHGSTISGRVPSSKPSINLPHDFIVATYNDVAGTEAILSSLPPNSLAAILLEPMLGSGGCYAAFPTFLSTLRRLATQHNALLIFDEVMTSRLGYHGLGHSTGIAPDLMTLGKWVGGGMSFGAFGGREDIMSMYDPRKGQLEHPGTFNNNVFSMGAGIAGCNLLTEERIDALNSLGDAIRKKIEDVLQSRGVTANREIPTSPVLDEGPSTAPRMYIKGTGSLLCIHFAGPDKEVLQGLFYHHMLRKGIHMAQRGFVALNICLDESHVERFVQSVEQFVEVYEKQLSG